MRQAGWETHDSTTNEPTVRQDLNTIVRKANASKADYFVSWHLNAGGGTGVEVLYNPNSRTSWSRDMAAKVSAAIARLMGIRDRGPKPRTNLAVLNGTNMPAILIETFFLDSQVDCDAYKRVGYDAIAKVAAEAITGKSLGASAAPAPAPAPVPAPAPSGAGLTVDGWWGWGTTKSLQQALGTPVDGEVWGQWTGNKRYMPNAAGGWQFSSSAGGSAVIRALQGRCGVTADGIVGQDTIRAIQRRYGVGQDGIMGPKTVKALQEALNKGSV